LFLEEEKRRPGTENAEKAVELIKRMPDEQVDYVFNILNNIEELAYVRSY
jgi:hypothetical protein